MDEDDDGPTQGHEAEGEDRAGGNNDDERRCCYFARTGSIPAAAPALQPTAVDCGAAASGGGEHRVGTTSTTWPYSRHIRHIRTST